MKNNEINDVSFICVVAAFFFWFYIYILIVWVELLLLFMVYSVVRGVGDVIERQISYG